VCSVPAYACAGTFKFAKVTLENTLLVVQKRLLSIFVVLLLDVYSILQTGWLTLRGRLGLFSKPRGNTAGFIGECS